MPSADVAPIADAAGGGLFAPFDLGRCRLANRFVMPAMQRGWGARSQPDERMIEYYRARAEGGVSLIISESCAIDHPSSAGQDLAMYLEAGTIDAWARCAQAVHGAGSAMFIQLWHEGALRREGMGRYPHAPTLSPSGLVHGTHPNGRAATGTELDELVQAYARSAALAQAAGADGVEVHGAHGYLIDQFLWPDTNRRTDGYGGPQLSDRLRFPAQVVRAIRASVSSDFLVGFRFSQWKEVDYGARICQSPEELGVMLDTLTDAGVDLFHASTRYLSTPEWDTDRTLAAWCKALSSVPVIAVGSVGLDVDAMTTFLDPREARPIPERSIEDLRERLARGEFDLVAVGRSVIGDPQWVRKAAEGRYADIRPFRRSDVDMTDWDMEVVEQSQALRSDEAPG